jgi:potassium/hydrogen antiporter
VTAEPLILAAAALLLGGVLLSKTSSRFGVPSLLLFLFLGMIAGSEGLIGIEFDDFELARSFGIIALGFILFSGGLSTRWVSVRAVLAPGVALASVGVFVSAVLLGALASLVIGVDWAEGMLLGAIIASTDAAAVFSILRSRGVGIRGRLGPLLELESGSNDPAAVFLTVGIIGLIEGTGPGIAGLIALFFVQMIVGAVVGYVLARAVVLLINRLRLEYDGLYPVLTVAFVLLTFEGATLLGGSGFLAAYVAGLTLANSDFLHKRSLMRFHDAIAWLMQIAMFVLLGLLVFPSELLPVAGRAVIVASLLMFVARPAAVWLTLLPFRIPHREINFVSWVGLRGATPVILATFPVVAGIPEADTIFNVVFFVVLTSVLLQGTSIPTVGRRLRVTGKPVGDSTFSFDAVIAGDAGHNLREITVPADSSAVGTSLVNLGLPRGALVVLLRRGDASVLPQGGTILEPGDQLLLLAEPGAYRDVRRLFGLDGDSGPAEEQP